jgi:hypothetical protein
MLVLMFAAQRAFPLFRSLSLLGCTRFGSPGIFGMLTVKRCARPGKTLIGDER